MDNKITFSDENRGQIVSALEEKLNISDPESQQNFINDIEASGILRAFGYGSLLTYSHLQNQDEEYKDGLSENFPNISTDDLIAVKPAVLEGYERDFVCFDDVYRGTQDAPAITLGIEANEDGKTTGGVLETDLSKMSPDMATGFVEYYLSELAEREIPRRPDGSIMPIYTFDVLEVESGGEKVMALAAIADANGPLYIHNENNDYAKKLGSDYYMERGDIEAKAKIVSSAHGDTVTAPGAGILGKLTILDYLKAVIESSVEKDIPIESGLHRLYTSSVVARLGMDPENKAVLEALELPRGDYNSPDFSGDFLKAIKAHNDKFDVNVKPVNNDVYEAAEPA